MKITSAGLSHKGLVRQENEDTIALEPHAGLFIVCDGMGGHAAGKHASSRAAEVIRQTLMSGQTTIAEYRKVKTPKTRSAVSALVEQAVQSAGKVLFTEGDKNPALKGMGTTAEVLLFVDDYAILGHVGDSRIYQIRDGKPMLLTEDHSVVAEMVRQGIWTVEQAAKSPFAHTLTRAVGAQPFVRVDTLEVELKAGDLFLLCSDGLSNTLKNQDLVSVASIGQVEEMTRALVQQALDRGGRDNVSTVLIRVDELGDAPAVAVDAGKKTELLKNVSLFRYLNHREIARVMSLATSQVFPKNQRIIEEGKPGTQIFIIAQGSVEILKGDQSLTTKKAGEILGEMAILDNSPRSASVVTSETTTCLVIQQKDLFDLLRRESQLAVKLLWALSQSLNQRLRFTTEQLAEVKATLELNADDGPDLEILG